MYFLSSKSYIPRRNFSTSLKVNRSFTDWPPMLSIIDDISDKERRGVNLWECDYSILTSAILAYYFHSRPGSSWLLVPEYNHTEGNHPDYTIFLLSNPAPPIIYREMIHAVVEVKSKTGDSWEKLLNQMWDQADVSKDEDNQLWAIGQKD